MKKEELTVTILGIIIPFCLAFYLIINAASGNPCIKMANKDGYGIYGVSWSFDHGCMYLMKDYSSEEYKWVKAYNYQWQLKMYQVVACWKELGYKETKCAEIIKTSEKDK
jgi:hypothetical protein